MKTRTVPIISFFLFVITEFALLSPLYAGFSGDFSQLGGAVYDGGSTDLGNSIAVDTFTVGGPYSYVVGHSSKGISGMDYLTIKYDAAGVMLASATFDGSGGKDDHLLGVVLDGSGNVFVTGDSHNGSNSDYVTIKYNNNLVFQSSAVFDTGSNDYGEGIAVDKTGTGNIYVTGYKEIGGGSFDYVTVKYSNNLVFQSSAVFNPGTDDKGYSIATDNSGNVFVIGESISGVNYDYVTVKYDSNLVFQSSAVFDSGQNDYGYGIAIDNSGNVFVTGDSNDTKYLTLKYSNNLVLQSSDVYTSGFTGGATAVAVDGSGNVFVTGELGNGTNWDSVTVKYNNNLVFQSSAVYNSGYDDISYGVAVGVSSYVYVTGYSFNGSNNDFRTIRYYFDDTAPAGISDLTVSATSNQGVVKLQWTSPGDDGITGPLTTGSQFQIKYSSVGIITASNYNSPPFQYYTVDIPTNTVNPVTTCSTNVYISNMQFNTTYWFAIKTKDDANNWSVWNSTHDSAAVNTAAFILIPSTVSSTGGGGLWSNASTWQDNYVPWPNQSVKIKASTIVTFDKKDTNSTCSGITIESGGVLQFEGAISTRAMVVAGNVDIQNGGQFLMPPNTGYVSTLKIKCNSAGEFGIIVNNGGIFDVQGSSFTGLTRNCLITSDNPSYKTYIRNLSQTEANFNMYYVEVSSVGVNAASKHGITFDGSGTRGKINYCSIHNGDSGIWLDNSSNNTISNNSIYSNDYYGIYLYYSSNNTLNKNSCYSNATSYGIYLNTALYNTISNNSCYSNTIGIDLWDSPYNTVSNNSCYSNTSEGIRFTTSSNNILSNNSCYSNGSYGISSGGSTNNTVVNCEFGKSGNNASGDIYYSAGLASKLTLKNCSLNSTTKVNTTGMDTAGSYLVSYNQDGTQGTTKVWGDYHILSGSTGTFNYAAPLYVSTFTQPNVTTKDAPYTITNMVTDDAKTLTELWEVKYNGVNFDVRRGTYSPLAFDGTATGGTPYTSSTRGVGFTFSATTYVVDDAFYFVSISSSNDKNVQKKLEFNDTPIGTRMFVENGGAVEMIGFPSPTISTNAAGSTYYGFQSSGSINLSNYVLSNLKSNGLEIYPQATVVDLSSGTFDTIQGSADSSYIRVNGITSNKTFYICAFNDTPGTANYNVKADGSGINWTFMNATGVKAGELYDYDGAGSTITWTENIPPTITDLQGGDDVVRTAAGTTYNVDFFDAGGLDTLQYRVWTLPGQTGTLVKDWTNIATLGGTTYYQTDWQVDFTSLNNLPTTNYVTVRAWDVSANTSTVSDVFYVMKDTVAPTSSIISPADSTNVQSLSYISGVVSDNYGINKVELQIKRFSDNFYWSGSNWQAGAVWVQTSNNNWQYYGLTDAALTVGTSYWVVSRASDTVGNIEIPGTGITFTYKTKKTISTGNWTDAAAWSGGQMPLDGDAVILKPPWTVTLNAGTSNLYSLTIESGAKLDSPTPYMVSITSFSGGGLYNYGTLADINGTLSIGGTSGSKVYLSTDNAQCFGSMFISAGSTVTLQSNLAVGYIDIASGSTLDANTRQINLSGVWQQNGTFIAGTSTVTFTGTNNQAIQGSAPIKKFANFTVNSSSTVSPSGPIDVTGDFTIQGGTFVAGSYNHAVKGNFKQTGGGFAAQTSTITFDGTAAGTVSVLAGTSFYCLQITNSGTTIYANSNLDINGNLTIDGSGAVFFPQSYTHNLAGSFILKNSGTWGEGTETFIFDGPGTLQEIPYGGNWYNFVVASGAKVGRSGGGLTPCFDHNFTVAPGGTFDATNCAPSFRGGTFASSGTFIATGSTITFEGSGNIYISGGANFDVLKIGNTFSAFTINVSTNLTAQTLVINKGTFKLVTSSMTVFGATTVDGATAKLEIGSSTATLSGQVQVLNGGTLYLPNVEPAFSAIKLGANYLNVDSGGFFVSQSSNNLITSTNPGTVFYTLNCFASTVNVTGVALQSAGYNIDSLFISSITKIVALNNVVFKDSLTATNRALSLGYTTIPGTFTFTGHQFESTVSTNVYAPNLTSGLVVMDKAAGVKAGPSCEYDPNDRVFWLGYDSMTVTQPAGGETYIVGASTAIKWTTSGAVKNVKLEYSKDNFATVNFIANVSSSSTFGSYNWVIPNDSSPTVKVRISAQNYSAVYSTSNSFAIKPPPQLVVILPGETYTDGVGKSGTPTVRTAGVSFIITVNATDNNYYIDPSAIQITTVTTTDNYDTEPVAANLVSGTKTFNITLVTAQVSTITASATGLTNGSSYLTVVPNSPVKLQVLVPGETAAGGSGTGKTGTPVNQQSGVSFSITVNAVDSYWNIVTSTAPTISVVTSDPADTEPSNKALVSGAATFTITPVTTGNTTITANDVFSVLAANTSPNITVNTESTPPTVAIVDPPDNSYKNALTAISGTAADNVAVSSVSISIRLSGGNYWDGSGFNSASQTWFDCVLYPSSWTFTAPAWTDGSSYTVITKARDTSNNWTTAYSTATFIYDVTSPVSTVTNPVNNSTISSLTTISGNGSDSVGLNKVELYVKRLSDGQYWLGASWSAGPAWLTATGTSIWQYTGLTGSDLTDNTSYQIVSKATDLAGNMETPGIGTTFTYLAPPVAPSGVTASLLGTTSVQWRFTDNASNETALYISSGPFPTMRLSGNLGPLSGTGGTTNWWEINLATNTQYTRYAEVNNAVGSNWSAIVSSYTLAVPPAGAQITQISSNTVTLTWSANSNPSYTRWGIIRSTDGGFATVVAVKDFASNYTGTSYTDTGVNPSTAYYYKINAFNGDGIATVYGLAMTTTTLSVPVLPPQYPAGFAATEVTNSSIKWLWTDVSNEQGYYLQTSTGGFVASVAADTVNYSETSLTPNTQYARYIEAYNVSGSSRSSVVSKYTLANLPANFVADSKDFNWLKFAWSANGNPVGTIYELYRSTDNASFGLVNQATVTFHTDTGLTQLTTYYYRLYSVNAEGIKTGPATATVRTLNSVIKGPVSGKVTQSDGTAILGVLVQLYNNEGTLKLGETTTKADGTYLFENLDDGIYRVVCSWLVNEIESVVYKTDIPENSGDVIFTLEIQYQLAQLAGKITLGSRANFVSGKFAPAQQPYVELLQRGRQIARIDADSNGNYTVPNLLPGKYVVRAFNGVQMSEPQEVQVKEGEKIMLNFRWALGLQDNEVYAFPNPCKDSVTIRYKANTNHTATLRIYNIAGELVREIKGDGSQFGVSSVKKIPWNLENDGGAGVASGVYIYILELKETADDGEKATVKKKLAVIK